MSDLQLRQTEERVGDRGMVHDTYNLIADGTIVATIRQYVEYTLEEVPVTFEPVFCNGVNLFDEEPESDDEMDARFEEEDTKEQIALRSSAH